MSNEENITLEDLKKFKAELEKDLYDLQKEENVVRQAVSNPKQMQQIQSLQNHTKMTKHSKLLLKTQNRKIAERAQITDEKKLIDYYRTLTGVTVNKISLKSLPLEEDPTDKCCYLYEVDANIENLQFNISYCSNKPPDQSTQIKEIIKKFKITCVQNTCQIEIQEGLDFFAANHPSIPSAILFLKSVNKLNIIRKNIVKELNAKHKKFVNMAIIKTGQLCLICKGIVHENNYFVLYWQIKWDHKTYNSARDSFKINVEFADKQLYTDTKQIFADICSYEKCAKYTEKQKLQIFLNLVNLVVEAESRNILNESDITVTEYSSIT